MSQRTEQLLAATDRLSHPERMRELARAVRAAAADGGLDELLSGLAAHGTYGRRLAATAAGIARHDAHLEACLADPDAIVRAPALRALRQGRIADDAVTAALRDAPAEARRRLVRTIAVAGRTALAESLIEPMLERWGPDEAAGLLPACTGETVVRLLPRLLRGVSSFPLLARRHPGPLLAELVRTLEDTSPGVRDAWLLSRGDALAALTDHDPLGVLTVLETYEVLPWQVYGRLRLLVEADPGRTVRLLLRPRLRPELERRGLEPAVLRRLVRHDPPELTDLAQALAARPVALAALLKQLPPARRPALLDAATAGQDLTHTMLDPALLDVLPHRRRIAEARRMTDQARASGAHWTVVLRAAAHLPPAEVRDELLAAVSRSDADDRAQAYPLLVRNAALTRDPGAVAVLLTDLQRLRNEQDPVRSAALQALTHVPAACFTAASAEPLTRIATDAVEARDSSWATRRAVRTLALAVLREHAAGGGRELIGWSLDTLTGLTGHSGGVDIGRLDTALRHGQEHDVVAALRPWLEAGADKADHALTFALVRALGRRAWRMPELQDLLWQAVQYGSDATVRTAVGLWLEQPRGRDERVGRIVALESSAAVLPPVLDVLVRRRTDLLDPALAPTPPYGRFLTAGSHWTPPSYYAYRWTPRQHRAAAALYARTAGGAGHVAHLRTGAIWSAARIPDAGLDVVRRYAGSPSIPLAEAALGALPWTDHPAEVLPLLLEHAGGDRARVAVYAATRAAQYVAPSRLGAQLRALTAPSDPRTVKVTSRKEAVRLAAVRLPAAEAARLLREAFDVPGQHHDVRAACVAFARGLLGERAVWPLLRAAAEGRIELRRALARATVFEVDPEHRPRYAALLRAACEPRDPDVAQALYPVLVEWAPWDPGMARVLAADVTDLTDRSTWALAADNLVRMLPEEADTYAGTLTALLTAAAVQPDAQPERDLPARQRIDHLTGELATRSVRLATPMRPVLLRTSEILAEHGHRDFDTAAARIRLHALDLDADADTLVSGLREVRRLCGGRPVAVAALTPALDARLRGAGSPGRTEALGAAADALAPGEGLFAVVLTAVGGERSRWAQPWRDRLRGLRAHPDPDVRAAARERLTAREAPCGPARAVQW
ncbi:hypothetical protein SRB5_48800 [Streptomyces sp. RB5]|uniref:HEAT repeat domain-containing protein n=1 Tax=Streptomyces smaragdinus TaxID=2585196 RepID=A0A7K0CPM3_9ACTN|nr:hypothetical protein [Streptomyces smaragdinus]MQY14704.1 hypothetical protein [Streptomyces smaragdinus]